MNRLVIVGCGRLAEIITNAVVKGMLPDYELVGVYSRTASKAEHIANKMRQHGKMCAACHTLKELLELKPDYLVESASPAAMKELALPTLENGTSIITGKTHCLFRQCNRGNKCFSNQSKCICRSLIGFRRTGQYAGIHTVHPWIYR